MKHFRRTLAVFTACVVAVMSLYSFIGGTVSAADGEITVDTATGTITGGAQGGVVYLELYSDNGEQRKQVQLPADAELKYEFKVVSGRAYISPETSGFDIGNAFTDAVRQKAGLPLIEEKYLPAGDYAGSISVGTFGWAAGKTTDCMMVRLYPDSQVVISEMKLLSPKTEITGVSDMLAAYTINANDAPGSTVDKAAGTVKSGSQYGSIYFDLYTESGARACIAPAADALLYYDFSVEMVEHSTEGETAEVHAYHGKASIALNPWGSSPSAITDTFMSKVAQAAGADMLEGKLPAGNYKGVVSLSSVWTADNPSNCIAVNLGEYTKVVLREMKFVTERPVMKQEEVSGGNLLAHYQAVASVNTITADTATNTVTSGANYGNVRFDLYQPDSDSRNEIHPVDGAVLYYDFTIKMVTHSGGENPYYGKASIAPIYGNSSVEKDFMNNISKNSGKPLLEGKLPEGDYKGSVNLSSVWGTGTFTNCAVIYLNEYTKIEIRELKFITISDKPEMVPVTGGNLLARYKAVSEHALDDNILSVTDGILGGGKRRIPRYPCPAPRPAFTDRRA